VSGTLSHSPADILRYALVSLGLGTLAPTTPWPVFAGQEPSAPDNCITVYDVAGTDSGYVQQGERQEQHGWQVRVRGQDHATGYAKARAVAVALDEDLYQETVTIGASSYLVWSVTRTSDVLSLGLDSPASKRHLFTVNGTICVRQL
jgi:hypothetical protein